MIRDAVWRDIVAFTSGALAFMSTMGGLFIVAPFAQSALIAGLAVGLTARSLTRAAAIGVAATAVSVSIGPASVWNPASTGPIVAEAALWAVACGGLAALVRTVVAGRREAVPVLVAAAALVLIGNLWYTPLHANTQPYVDPGTGMSIPPFDEQLRGDVPEYLEATDGVLYYRVFESYRDGGDFYEEFHAAYRSSGSRPPARSQGDFRTPTLFWLWRLLPDARGVVLLYLAFASAAVLSCLLITPRRSLPLAIPACTAIASYLVVPPTQHMVFLQEPWSAILGVLALAAHALSLSGSRWRAWVVAAVSLVTLAVLVRETIAFLAIAGAVSSLVGARDQRRFRMTAWAIGLFIIAGATVAQYLITRPYWLAAAELPRVGRGSLEFMLAGFRVGTECLGQGHWLPTVLALVGIAGAVTASDVRLRLFASLFIASTAASFLVLGNDAWAAGQGVVNYWGIVMLPVVYALMPAALELIPRAFGAEAKG